nr:hypothetical protein [Verrucomicrobiota bacterium]
RLGYSRVDRSVRSLGLLAGNLFQRALEQASAQANPESVAALRAQLERYRSGLPFRDAPPPAR